MSAFKVVITGLDSRDAVGHNELIKDITDSGLTIIEEYVSDDIIFKVLSKPSDTAEDVVGLINPSIHETGQLFVTAA